MGHARRALRGRLRQLLIRSADAYGFPTPVWTTQRVADLLWRRFEVSYHLDHVGRLLHQCGLSWQKAGSVSILSAGKHIGLRFS
jgi:transposase